MSGTIDIRRYRRHSDGEFIGQTETYRPFRNRNGKYLLGDPSFGCQMHHKVNRVEVSTLEEAADLVRSRRFSLWMKGNLTGQQNLISAARIEIEN